MDRSPANSPTSSGTYTSPEVSASSDVPKFHSAKGNLASPIVIGLTGNEQFLDKVAALFVRQILAARETEREQKDDMDERPDLSEKPAESHLNI